MVDVIDIVMIVAEGAALSQGCLKGAVAGIVVGVAMFGMAFTGSVFVRCQRRQPLAAVRVQIERCKWF